MKNKKVVLLGLLGEKFGREWNVGNADNLKDIFKLIDCQTPGFRKFIIEAIESNIDAAIMHGDQTFDEPEEIFIKKLVDSDDIIYVSLVPSGAKGWGKIMGAIALAVFAFAMPIMFPTTIHGVGVGGLGSTTIANTGMFAAGGSLQLALYSVAVNLALAGVTELLVKQPEAPGPGEGDTPIFNGPSNNVKSGQAVPILYGKLMIGGTPLSINYKPAELEEAFAGIPIGRWATMSGEDEGYGFSGSIGNVE